MGILILFSAWIVAVAVLGIVAYRHRTSTILATIALVVIMVFVGKKIYASMQITIPEYMYALLFGIVFTVVTFISMRILKKIFNRIKLS